MRFAFPRIGEMPLSTVTSAEVIGIQAPNWHTKPTVARKLCQRIRAVMEWAAAMDLRPDNPCDRIGPVLGVQGHAVRHMRAPSHGEVASAIEKVKASKAQPIVRRAFEFLVLTATRSGEVRAAAWAEIDREEGVWTISAPHTKANRERRVPLSFRGLQIMEEVRTLGRGSPLVFPSVRGNPLGRTAWSRLVKGLGSGQCRTVSFEFPGLGGRGDRSSPGCR